MDKVCLAMERRLSAKLDAHGSTLRRLEVAVREASSERARGASSDESPRDGCSSFLERRDWTRGDVTVSLALRAPGPLRPGSGGPAGDGRGPRRDECAASTGLELWGGATRVAEYLLDHRDLVAGKNVVELAAGAGLPGLVASKLGARSVLLTDLDATVVDRVGTRVI